jgi:hypothetical protein
MDSQNKQYLQIVERDHIEGLACILFYALGNPITSFCSLHNARSPAKVITRLISLAKVQLEGNKVVARGLTDLAVQRPDVALYVDKRMFEHLLTEMPQQDAVDFIHWMGTLPEEWARDHGKPMAYLYKQALEW